MREQRGAGNDRALRQRNRFAPFVEELEQRTVPNATITVNTHLDVQAKDNDLSLREAILLANGTLTLNDLSANEKALVMGTPAANQADKIHFNLANPNNAIALNSKLEAITDQVTIDGFTQIGSGPNTAPFGQPRNATYRIELDGTMAGGNAAFRITAGSGTLIRGLAIVSFSGGAVEVRTNKNTIEDNSIGIDRGGQAKGNGASDLGGGAVIIRNASENLIKNNLISGNSGASPAVGVWITFNAKSNRLEGNYIGTDASGQSPIPNGDGGVSIDLGASSNIIGGSTLSGTGNLISGNKGSGVTIFGVDTTDNRIQANLIGTDATGTTKVPNGAAGGGTFNIPNGVTILDASGNLIGGDQESLGNVVSGNTGDGVRIWKNTDKGVADSNKVRGNHSARISADSPVLATVAMAFSSTVVAATKSAARQQLEKRQVTSSPRAAPRAWQFGGTAPAQGTLSKAI